jgi:hypothetical protein
MENNNDITYHNIQSIDSIYYLIPPVLIILAFITSFRSWLKLNLVFSNVFGLIMILNPEILISEIVKIMCYYCGLSYLLKIEFRRFSTIFTCFVYSRIATNFSKKSRRF